MAQSVDVFTGFEFNIARGLQPGMEAVHKFGAASAAGTANQTLWSGSNTLIPYLSAATTMKVSSTSTADVMTSGTGAWTVRLEGLDANYDTLIEDVELNGRTEVATTGEFLRLFRMQVLTAGTGLKNAGEIWVGTGTVTTGVPAVKYGHIETGENQSLMAFYTVPAGYTAYIFNYSITASSGKSIDVKMYGGEGQGVMQLQEHIYVNSTTFEYSFAVPRVFPEKKDLEIRVTSSGSGTGVAGGFDFILVKN